MDPVLVDQIAAGEVVERPASVVKELLDNALDAGAQTIRVVVEAGGTERITVSDDGHGMDEANARLSIERHATSKLRSLDGLHTLTTLGFRGEALASIASVSHFELRTRRSGDEAATSILVDGGVVRSVSPAGAAPGTTIDVRELFYNVPARRKFLRAQQTESAHIADVCLRAVLGRPELRLVLQRGERTIKEYLPVADLGARVRGALPRFDLEEFRGERNGLRVTGFLSRPEDSRSGSGGLHIFVNGRPVRERRLSRAVSFAYGARLTAGRYPTGALFLEVDSSLVDVNVHPQKTEVRFERGAGILDSLTRLVASGMGTAAWSKAEATAPRDYWSQRNDKGPSLRETAHDSNEAWGLASIPEVSSEVRVGEVGELPAGLAIHSTSKALYVCDVAGLLKEHWEREAAADGVPSQALLLPYRLDLSRDECAALLKHAGEMASAGFSLSSLGPETLAVQRCPKANGDVDFASLAAVWVKTGSLKPFRLSQVIRINAKHAVEHGWAQPDTLRLLVKRACLRPDESSCVREHHWDSLTAAEWRR